MRIKTLNQETINKIAAGEVILRPASVVKELVENSLDSGADRITVRVSDGGKKEIAVIDNGCGISYDEIPLAFKRHATSKISRLSDLDDITTMGFRGEALSSIAAVASIVITTKSDEEELGSNSIFEQGDMLNRRICPYEKGTEIVVSDIFKDIPARYKFLKKDSTEEKIIKETVQKLALSHPNVSFTYESDGKKRFQTLGNGSLKDAAYSIYGSAYAAHLHEFEKENLPMKVYGLIGDLDARRTYRDNQIFFINGRYVKSKFLSKAFEEEWAGKLMKHQYPSGIIFIELPPKMLDVNVHPQKTEIRILNKSLVTILFKQCIREALSDLDLIPESIPEEIADEEEKPEDPFMEIPEPEQQSFTAEMPEILPIADEVSTAPLENDFEPISIEQLENLPSNDKTIPEPDQIEPLHREVPEKSLEQNRLNLTEMNLIGQIFNTYLILEGQNFIYIIDQHAAHEAVLYEEFKKALSSGKGFESQGMIIPVEVSASKEELDEYSKVRDRLESFGFDSSIKGDKLIVTAVPLILNIMQPAELIIPLINYFSGKSSYLPDMGIQKIVSMSCKAAIKGGDSLDQEEINTLLSYLSKLDNPYTCPHGRPVIRKQSEYELEKLFKRVV